MTSVPYAELHARSAFSFLRGTAQPEALATGAAALGVDTVAVCDRMGLYGTPRFRTAAQRVGLRDVVGAELLIEDGTVLPVLVQNRTGYQNLCQLLTRAHLRADKGEGSVQWRELPEFAAGLFALTGGEEGPVVQSLLRQPGKGRKSAASPELILQQLVGAFGQDRVYVEIQRHHRPDESRWNRKLIDLASVAGLPLLATNGVEYVTPEGRAVADVFTCLREHTHLDLAGDRLSVNAERHLKSPAAMAALFADLPAAITHTRHLSEQLDFQLVDLGYEFPAYPVGADETMPGVLRDWTRRGAAVRYPAGIPAKVEALLHKELALIEQLGFAGYFLIVADLVKFCREHDILAQGRGSAVNSAVCFCLGITAVDPVRFNVLFERFLSAGRKGWPDIDIDLPSGDRREAVIQEVYRRYGPHGAAMTGAIHTYRGRGTAREVGKVLNLPGDVLDRFSSLFGGGGDHPHTLNFAAHLQQAGLPAEHPRAAAFASLYEQIAGLPRHLGQHSGGMVICQSGLNRFVPLENAAMPGRVVAQWDKDDCADLGIIKVDLLGLGMMAALQEAVTLTAERGRPVDLAQLPENDAPTYDLLCRADTIGVFQVESRAQMATLPRMQPRCFYDLVVEVAIIRPGPIQGDLAHPYLRRRTGEEAVTYYDPRLVPILERTLGVPLFQEQMLQIAMEMADFSGAEAEELRKALSFHRSDERMVRAAAKLRAAMAERGVPAEVSERIAKAVGSFALYGFPESHAISFALLAYASAYLKTHRAPEFFAALLNNQPMGFYSPATLIRDAKRHGVVVRPVCAARSDWRCTVGPDDSLRLGLVQVEGLRRTAAESLLAERARAPFTSMTDFLARTQLDAAERRTLASIGALNVWAEHRRAALWETGLPLRQGDLFDDPDRLKSTAAPASAPLPRMSAPERLRADYAGLLLTTGPHPMELLRPWLPTACWRATDLPAARGGDRICVAGQVICRQRPGTAKGVCFVSLEDETGIVNIIVAPDLFEATRLMLTSEPFLIVEGVVQLRHRTIHIQAEALERLDYAGLATAASHDFG